MPSAVGALGREILAALRPASPVAEDRKTFLENYRPGPGLYADDAYAWLACVLALQSVCAGNFGIGCVLADGDGRVVEYGHNRMFNPYFRSDLHAEMVVVNAFEDRCRNAAELGGYCLYTSLEPCPMCMVRLISSRIAAVKYVAPDLRGGMARQLRRLPEFWAELGSATSFAPAACSVELREAAQQILLLNLEELTAQLSRAVPVPS